MTLERTSEDLLAIVPFTGDQRTSHAINTYVDDLVGSVRSLQAQVDDLHRVMLVAQQRERLQS